MIRVLSVFFFVFFFFHDKCISLWLGLFLKYFLVNLFL